MPAMQRATNAQANADEATIRKGRHRVATIATPLRNVSPFGVAHALWRVPRGAHGHLRFSVRSIDAAGNKSRLAWASLDVR